MFHLIISLDCSVRFKRYFKVQWGIDISCCMQSLTMIHAHGEKFSALEVFMKSWISWSHGIWSREDAYALRIYDSEADLLRWRTMQQYLVEQATVWSKRNTGAGGRDVPTIWKKCGINVVSFDEFSWSLCTIWILLKSPMGSQYISAHAKSHGDPCTWWKVIVA